MVGRPGVLQHDLSVYELPGITSLQQRAQQATTCSQLTSIRASMFRDYHVYLVMTPQTQLTIQADEETFLEGALTARVTQKAQQLSGARGSSNSSSGTIIVSDLRSQVAAAQTLTNGLATTLLQQTPPGWPGNQPVLAGAAATLAAARSHLDAAQRDLFQLTHLR